MTHGISDTLSRPKYQSGLVFDVKALVKHFESNGQFNHVLINEIGTLLVLDDIPEHCIIHLVAGPAALDEFWSG
jgi:hypothetical protein